MFNFFLKKNSACVLFYLLFHCQIQLFNYFSFVLGEIFLFRLTHRQFYLTRLLFFFFSRQSALGTLCAGVYTVRVFVLINICNALNLCFCFGFHILLLRAHTDTDTHTHKIYAYKYRLGYYSF